jgi:cyclin C
MEDLNFNLVLFSPYRSLVLFCRDAGIGEQAGLRAWTLLNDSYHCDVSLLHAPHMVALACIQLAVVNACQVCVYVCVRERGRGGEGEGGRERASG